MRVPSLRRVSGPSRVAAILLALVAVLGSSRGWADDYTNRIGLMLGGGAYKLVGGNSDHAKVGPWAATGVRFGWTNHWDFEGSFRYGINSDITQTYRTRTTGADIGLLYNARPDAGWTWQAFAGTGILWWNVMKFDEVDENGNLVPREPSSVFDTGRTVTGYREDGNQAYLSDSNFKFYGGLGAETRLTSHLSFRIGARIDYLVRQSFDNTGASDVAVIGTNPSDDVIAAKVDANDLMPSAFGALTWWFGMRDADGDGLENRLDQCPSDAEDRDGFQDEDGCPDLDNDKDGVADAQDKCVDEPEDMDGFQDEDGCPDLDNDGDGIPDPQDKCPDVAEDKDGFQDEDGCPDLDNDGDGIPDASDLCPDTPAGVRVDSTGCVLAKSAREKELIETGTIRLSHVKFELNKADIKPEFASMLDSVATGMANWPVVQIEIGGHTDSRGNDAKNAELSRQRAQAALDYLKSKDPGLDAGRFTVKGYGETMPIADNTTEEGRAANRRVEFKVLNPEELQAEVRRRMGTMREVETPPDGPKPEEKK